MKHSLQTQSCFLPDEESYNGDGGMNFAMHQLHILFATEAFKLSCILCCVMFNVTMLFTYILSLLVGTSHYVGTFSCSLFQKKEDVMLYICRVTLIILTTLRMVVFTWYTCLWTLQSLSRCLLAQSIVGWFREQVFTYVIQYESMFTVIDFRQDSIKGSSNSGNDVVVNSIQYLF